MALISILLLLITNSFSYAKNHALILGGGGEATVDGEEYMFGSETTNIDNGLVNWDKTILFGSDTSSKTRRNGTLTKKNILNELKKISEKAKPGDQVLIYITNHGYQAGDSNYVDDSDTNSQTIALGGDHSTKNNSMAISSLKESIDLMSQKNIKVAIVNSSCFSGASLESFSNDKNLCLLSIAGKDSVGMTGGYTDILAASLAKKRTGTYRWDREEYKIPIIDLNTENSLKPISLLKLATESLKQDKLNLEVSALGSKINSNGHYGNEMNSAGYKDALTKMDSFINNSCTSLINKCDSRKKSELPIFENIFCKSIKLQHENIQQLIQQVEIISKKGHDANIKIRELDDYLYQLPVKLGDDIFNELKKLRRNEISRKEFSDTITSFTAGMKDNKMILDQSNTYADQLKLRKDSNLEKEALESQIKQKINEIKSEIFQNEKLTNSNLKSCDEFKL